MSFAASHGGTVAPNGGGFDLLTITGSGDDISIGNNLQNNLPDDLVIQAAGSFKGWKINLGKADDGASLSAHNRTATVYGSSKNDTR